jgi:hypothetical protein
MGCRRTVDSACLHVTLHVSCIKAISISTQQTGLCTSSAVFGGDRRKPDRFRKE